VDPDEPAIEPTRTARDPLLGDVAEATLRLAAGLVPPPTLQKIRAQVLADTESFPWREVNERILAVDLPEQQLLQQGLRFQRDTIVRGGRSGKRRTLKSRGKSLLAVLLARGIFFVVYTVAVVVLLILLKHQWPGFDIYSLLDGLKAALPGIFGSV